MMMPRLTFRLLATAVSTLLPLATAHALSAGGVGGYPANPDSGVPLSESWFIYNLDLGESKDDALLLFNDSDDAATIKLYVVDSIPSNQGNFALAAEDAPKKGIGAWVDLSESLVTLNPGEERTIPFTITIPDTADVGEHSGGIILQKAQEADEVTGEAASASIVTRVGIRIYETVPGEIVRDLEVVGYGVDLVESDTTAPYYQTTLTVQNTSNVSLKPEADLVITGWGKEQYIRYSRFTNGVVIDFRDLTDFFHGTTLTKDWQLLRDQRVTTRWDWPRPVFGRFTFTVTLSYEGTDGRVTVTTPGITKWVIPWAEVAGILIGILLIVTLLIIRRMARSTRKWKKYRVQTGDQLPLIAKRAGTSWKKLAKVNKLKDPSVQPGQELLVPPAFPGNVSKGFATSAKKGKIDTKDLQEPVATARFEKGADAAERAAPVPQRPRPRKAGRSIRPKKTNRSQKNPPPL